MSRNTRTTDKKVSRPILEHNSRPSLDSRKKARFDEDNIRDTLHPEGKDYGHMKIDEPKTPYTLETDGKDLPGTSRGKGGVDANALQKKLQQEIQTTNAEEKKKMDFQEKRKAHYDEFKTVKAIKNKQDIEEEDSKTSTTRKYTNGANKSSSSPPSASMPKTTNRGSDKDLPKSTPRKQC